MAGFAPGHLRPSMNWSPEIAAPRSTRPRSRGKRKTTARRSGGTYQNDGRRAGGARARENPRPSQFPRYCASECQTRSKLGHSGTRRTVIFWGLSAHLEEKRRLEPCGLCHFIKKRRILPDLTYDSPPSSRPPGGAASPAPRPPPPRSAPSAPPGAGANSWPA